MSATAQVLGFNVPPVVRQAVAQFQHRRSLTAADRSLAKRLHVAFQKDQTGASGLAIYVHCGAVSVYGSVQNAAVRDAVLAVAAEQPGVRRIVDHLMLTEA